MFKGFRDFILRGNVVDLAVAVVIGAAFVAITSSLTVDLITPLISAVVGVPDFSSLVIHVPVLHQFRHQCGRSLLPRCASGFEADGPLQQAHRCSRYDQAVPPVPVRYPAGRNTLQILHATGLASPNLAPHAIACFTMDGHPCIKLFHGGER
jgi:hypothetical protein